MTSQGDPIVWFVFRGASRGDLIVSFVIRGAEVSAASTRVGGNGSKTRIPVCLESTQKVVAGQPGAVFAAAMTR